MGSSATPPDYAGLQKSITNASTPTINTPWATQSWDKGPNGELTQNTSLAGGLGDAAKGLQGQLGALGQPMNWSQFGPVQDGSQARDQAITAAYGQATSRLNPQFDNAQERLNAQLANQGFAPGSAATQSAQSQLAMQKNDAYGSAMNSAIGQGTAAGNSVFQNNTLARQMAISDALRQRGQPMQELQQLQGFLPNSTPGMGLQGAQGAANFANQAYLQQQNAANAANQGAEGTAAGVGSAAMSLLPFLLAL